MHSRTTQAHQDTFRAGVQDALKPIGAKKEVTLADFKSVMAGLTDTTPTKDIVNAFKVFDKDVSDGNN